MKPKAKLTWYCMKCKKEIEDQDQHEECYYKGHKIKCKYQIEIIESRSQKQEKKK